MDRVTISPSAVAHRMEKNTAKGVAFMLAALFVLTCSDVLTKWLGGRYPPGQVIFVRALFAMLPVIAMAVWRGGIASFAVHDAAGQAKRALASSAASSAIALSVILMPIADAAAILYASPLIVTALVWPMLGERVDWQRLCAVVVGFFGVLIMLRPTSGAFQLVGLVPLSAAFLTSIRDIYSRRLSATETTNAIQLWSNAALILLSAFSLPFGWVSLTWGDLVLMACAGCFVGLGQYLAIEAYRAAEAMVVAPIKYTGLVWAAVFGYAIWGTLPDAFILTGGVLVVAAGLFILRIETKKPRHS